MQCILRWCGVKGYMSTEEEIEQYFEEKRRRQELELELLKELIESGCDEEGNYILEEYPYKVVLARIQDIEEALQWAERNVNQNTFMRVWVDHFYFKNLEDATGFKLIWG